jgi:hypothetical protein
MPQPQRMLVALSHIVRGYKTSASRLRPYIHYSSHPHKLATLPRLPKLNRNMATKVEKTDDEWRAILSSEQASRAPFCVVQAEPILMIQ